MTNSFVMQITQKEGRSSFSSSQSFVLNTTNSLRNTYVHDDFRPFSYLPLLHKTFTLFSTESYLTIFFLLIFHDDGDRSMGQRRIRWPTSNLPNHNVEVRPRRLPKRSNGDIVMVGFRTWGSGKKIPTY